MSSTIRRKTKRPGPKRGRFDKILEDFKNQETNNRTKGIAGNVAFGGKDAVFGQITEPGEPDSEVMATPEEVWAKREAYNTVWIAADEKHPDKLATSIAFAVGPPNTKSESEAYKPTIEEALLTVGVDFSNGTFEGEPIPDSYLPLAAFDDVLYEKYKDEPSKWLDPATGSAKAKVLVITGSNNQTASWEPCVVVGYNSSSNMYSVVFQEENGSYGNDEDPDNLQVQQDRNNICFDTENPHFFAARVAAALRGRSEFEQQVAYGVYIDEMPTGGGLPNLATHWINRIIDVACNTKLLRGKQEKLNVGVLTVMANNEYQRHMNKIIFDLYMKSNMKIFSPLGVRLPSTLNVHKIPQNGTLPLELARDDGGFVDNEAPTYNQNKSLFTNVCIYTSTESAFKTLELVAAENTKLDSQLAYTISESDSPPCRLQNFIAVQTSQMKEIYNYMDGDWVAAVKDHILTNMKDEGREFNLKESNREKYVLTQLSRFLRLVNYTMSDSLRYFVLNSIEAYKNMILSAGGGTEYIEFVNEVVPNSEDVSSLEVAADDESKEEPADNPAKIKPEHEDSASTDKPDELSSPLFILDVSIAEVETVKKKSSKNAKKAKKAKKDKKSGMDKKKSTKKKDVKDEETVIPKEPTVKRKNFVFQTSPEDIHKTVVELMETTITTLGGIPIVERKVMNRLYWKTKPSIASCTLEDDAVKNTTNEINEHFQACIGPVNKYLSKTFKKYVKFIRSDIDTLLDALEKKYDGSEGGDPEENMLAMVEEVTKKVKKHSKEIKSIATNIPDAIRINIFEISCLHIKNVLIHKHQNFKRRLLNVLAESNNKACQALNERFEVIMEHFRLPVDKIEQLDEMEEYIKGCPDLVNEINLKAKRIHEKFGLLDEMKFQLADDDFINKWTLYGYPHYIYEKMKSLKKSNAIKMEEYSESLKDEQQLFDEELLKLDKEVQDLQKYNELSKLKEVVPICTSIRKRLESMKLQTQLFNSRESLFGSDITEYSALNGIAKAFLPFENLWMTCSRWQEGQKSWFKDQLLTLNPEQIEKDVAEFTRKLNKSAKAMKKSGLSKIADVAKSTMKEVKQFSHLVPLVMSVVTPGMRDRHWEAMATKLSIDIDQYSRDFTLEKLQNMGVPEHLEEVTKIGEIANKEYQIEKAMEMMRDQWKPIVLVVEPYRETGTSIFKEADVIIALLDEHITMTQAMSFSSFNKPFKEDIEAWDKTLSTVSEVVEEWLAVQRNWLYLQPIFDSDDIKRQLPSESKRFFTVDKNWRQTMKDASKNALAIEFCDSEKLYERFRESNNYLDMVQKGLSDYLETKRAAFSRFYFLSNDELLEILSETKDPTKVQPHLKKCFEAIVSVNFNKQSEITCMRSREKEQVQFVTNVKTKDIPVESWMNDLQQAMCDAVKSNFYAAVQDYLVVPRTEWMQKWPGQLVLNCSQVHWTKEMEAAMEAKGAEGVKEYYQKQLQQLNDMVALVRSPNLAKLARSSVGALSVIDVHARDVSVEMIKIGVKDKKAFLWMSQIRYYWIRDTDENGEDLNPGVEDWTTGKAFGIMVTSKRRYSCEYLGNSFRLVITPLTDKCYLTLMGALEMILGGSPAGPAGTGKTETVKDLAKGLAKQCVVFNCSDGMDYKMTGKFFKGLASCGAWCCFDEFNRILIEVLSVIAQQIMTLQAGVLQGKHRVLFEGTDIALSWEFAVFITMNPGYAGRTELPDNLAALFRPVAMMVPDYAMIGEIMLFAYGFGSARKCAQKMVATFTLCSEQCSNQPHYDYGMRAVKTVIVASGNLKREEPDLDEEMLMLRGLIDVNVPKFLSHDLPLFEGIMGDLFPGKTKQYIDYGALLSCMKIKCKRRQLMPTPWFIEKVIQLYEMICVRHGLMVVGPTNGGKSSCIRVLQETLTMLKDEGVEGNRFETVWVKYINPKSITMGQLYGCFDPNTHEWQDGVLANMIRLCVQQADSSLKWVLFDGPVDTLWIESMNTVLDDNKKLCLNSGEMVALSSEMTMMFEPADLAVASPATVSRCGMIYMQPHSLGYSPITDCWLENIPACFSNEMKIKLMILMDVLLQHTMTFLRRNLKECVPTVNHQLQWSLHKLLDCFFASFIVKDGEEPIKPEVIANFEKNIEQVFAYAFTWSVCVTVNLEGRKKLDSFIRNTLDSNNICQTPNIPNEGMIYDYWFDIETTKWIYFQKLAPEYVFDGSLGFNELVVPTMDTARYTKVLDMLLINNHHVMMCGPTGTGKTVNISKHLQSGMDKMYIPLCFTFSAQTSANQTQDIIDGKCDKRRKGVFGPMAGKRYLIFVDDCNMPQREIYGAQPPIELLRQWLCGQGWYDRKTLKWRQIIDSTLILACGPPGGGKNPVTPRFKRHFNCIAYTQLENSVMYTIFKSIFEGFLANFEPEVQKMCESIVWSSIEIYNTTVSDLLPTPIKPHYTFNTRDLAKVFQGLLMATNRKITSSIQIARMWVHEICRVFADRLVNDEDEGWFKNLVFQRLENQLQLDKSEVLPNDLLLYGDFMIPGADPRIYAEVVKVDEVLPIVNEYLADYNAESKNAMNLVLFTDAIRHVSRISRIIRQPLGNVLLLGVGGSGRQSLTRLATFMAEYECFQVEIAKGYGLPEWREDLKQCLLKAGVDNKPVVFLFVDTQIVFEGMLEDINNILNSGDVPNLYGPEEMEQINNTCRIDCQKKRIPPTKINIYAQYIIRVRRNIHMVIAMSPMGEPFRRRLRMFPSFVNCCTIDWFAEWPNEALLSVATNSMNMTDMELGDSFDKVVDFFKTIHQTVANSSKDFLTELGRHNYVTPTSYLELLDTYKKIIKIKRIEVGDLRDKLQNGLNKLISTGEAVNDLQTKLEKMQPELAATQIEVDAMIVTIKADTVEADKTKAIVQEAEAEANIQAAEAKAIADDAQRDLDEALPALEEAVACLKLLKKADIDEVKSLKTPPSGVKLTMEVCCVMFSVKPVLEKDPNKMGAKIKNYFAASKTKLLSDAKAFLARLTEFDKDNMEDALATKLKVYVDDPNFTPKMIEKASKACKAVCMWARAMYKYHTVAKEVEPKRILLASAQESLAITMKKLKSAQDQLSVVTAKLDKLDAQLQESLTKKDNLAREVKLCADRLVRADVLIGGLGGEKIRWAKSVDTLTLAYDRLIGDVLIASGTVAYLGPFTPGFRKRIVDIWNNKLLSTAEVLPFTDGCNMTSVLAEPIQVQAWKILGLPTDGHSLENAIVMDIARRWPLLIDPQSQANRFIRNMGRDKSLAEGGMDITKLTDPNFLRTLENGVRFGKWILLENILEKLDASMEPLLQQQLFKQGGTLMIRLGDSTIPWNDTFKFFMTTKLPNPHYPPEVCVKVTLLNFTITPGGLEDQLLGVVIAKERPDLEAQKSELVISNAGMKKTLKGIEDQILQLLKDSSGNILDDVALIEALDVAKKTSNEINTALKEAEQIEATIDSTREEYRPAAFRGSLLYFCISLLADVDPMYQYSLQWFTALFTQGIEEAEQNDDVSQRVKNLIEFITYKLYENICRSLFEAHKLLFSFMMAIKILIGAGTIDMTQWKFLISGIGPSVVESPNPAPEWIIGRAWNEVQAISSISIFEGLYKSFTTDLPAWRKIYDSATPQTEPLPGKWNDLNSLQKLCVLRILRPDKVTEAVQLYVIEHLEQRFVEPPPFNLNACFNTSKNNIPLIFVLTTGSDPTKMFYEYAEEMGFGEKVKGISLGQGQDVVAEKMIDEGVKEGTWVYLQNAHLYISWMSTLEQICEEIDPEECHQDYRLWLTSMPSKDFPVSVLQNGVKMTLEPPKGLKANLKNAYFKLDDEKLQITTKPFAYQKLLFALCFFHANVQERRKFGPLGWNKPYDFNDTDLAISKAQLEKFIDTYDEVPFKVLNIMTSYINYGGRVTDYIDLRTIDVILRRLFTEEILGDDYSFSPSGLYYSVQVDKEHPHDVYMDYIDKLPLNPAPEAFGMHENANIICAETETTAMFSTILSLEARSSGGGGKSREDILDETADTIFTKIPEVFEVQAIAMIYPLAYNESMNTVLVQECMRYNPVVDLIKTQLPQLRKALKGLVVMSVELENVCTALFTQKVPDTWANLAFPSLKPLNSWVDELAERLAFLQKWADEGIPPCFWISGFYFPQAFLTGTKQNYARKYTLPIDTLEFDFIVLDDKKPSDFTEKAEDGCRIYGLYLEGCRWNYDKHTLDDSLPKQLYTETPLIYLLPHKDREEPDGGIYRCPVYKELSRAGILSTTGHSTNFVLWLELPGGREDIKNNLGMNDQEYWIKAGVAAFTALRY